MSLQYRCVTALGSSEIVMTAGPKAASNCPTCNRWLGLIALVVGTGVRIVVVGILVGIALVLLSGQLVAAMLYATSPHDPVVMIVASAALIVIAVLASALPAWRASRVDPMITLRAE